jgi:hypothetical protein
MSKFVLDATVWLNFARAEAIDVLVNGLQGELVVGMIVRQREMLRWPTTCSRAGQLFSFDAFVSTGLVDCAEMNIDELGRFSTVKASLKLGDGETEAFVIAANRNWTVATDDGAARKRFNSSPSPPPISGSIGLLRVLANARTISRAQAGDLLRLMRDRGGRLPDETI